MLSLLIFAHLYSTFPIIYQSTSNGPIFWQVESASGCPSQYIVIIVPMDNITFFYGLICILRCTSDGCIETDVCFHLLLPFQPNHPPPLIVTTSIRFVFPSILLCPKNPRRPLVLHQRCYVMLESMLPVIGRSYSALQSFTNYNFLLAFRQSYQPSKAASPSSKPIFHLFFSSFLRRGKLLTSILHYPI